MVLLLSYPKIDICASSMSIVSSVTIPVHCVHGHERTKTNCHCNFLPFSVIRNGAARQFRRAEKSQCISNLCPIRRAINSKNSDVFPEALITPTKGLHYSQGGHAPPFADPCFTVFTAHIVALAVPSPSQPQRANPPDASRHEAKGPPSQNSHGRRNLPPLDPSHR